MLVPQAAAVTQLITGDYHTVDETKTSLANDIDDQVQSVVTADR